MPGANRISLYFTVFALCFINSAVCSADFPKPYSPPCTERENVFSFTKKPTVEKKGEK